MLHFQTVSNVGNSLASMDLSEEKQIAGNTLNGD